MSMIRPIGKSSKLACFEKETTEGTFVNPSKEIPFKSCDVKKTMKTEEDSSLMGAVFTTDLIAMGYDIQGNIELNAYPETLGDVLYFSLGKSEVANPIRGFVTLRYIGTAKKCRFSKSETNYIVVEVYNTNWTTLLTIDLTNKTVEQLSNAFNANSNLVSYYWGSGNVVIDGMPEVEIKNEYDNITYTFIFNEISTVAKNHKIYASNDVNDKIPSFSLILDKGFGTGKAFGYAGCKVNTFGLSFATKTFLTNSISIRAKKELSEQEFEAMPFSMTNPFTTNNCRIFINGFEFNDIKDLKIDVNNNMYIDEAVGVDTYNAQDRQGGTINISGTANLTIEDNNNQTTYILNQKYEKNEAIDLLVMVESPIELDTDIKSMFMIYIPKIKLSDGTVSVGGAERLSLSFAGQAVKCSLTESHIVTFINNKRLIDY